MTRILRRWAGCGLAITALALGGCGGNSSAPAPAAPAVAKADTDDAEVAAERAKLSPEDRALVEAQEWCVNTGERLGAMGPPIKLDVKGQPVFVCCGGCKAKAEADPDKTLAKLAELKAKKAGTAAKP